jgi:hypothetical protein
MAPRALGALFALVAALCFTGAMAGAVVPKLGLGWWDGPPTVETKVIERKAIHVGLLGAYGCNLGETVVCQELSTGGSLDVIGLAELAALGLIIITTFILMRSAWKIGDHRKLLGKLVLIEVALVSAGGAVILVLGPDIKANQHVEVPLGLGMMLFWGGVASAGLASVIALRLEPEPLRLRTSLPQIAAATAPTAYDVRELLREDHESVRPAVPPSPGGNLAGPSGHLGPHQSSPPLFEQAPQLRPLYDMQQAPPTPVAPPLPTRGPTPMPRAAVGQHFGIPTPPPLETPTPPTKGDQVGAFAPLAEPAPPPYQPFGVPTPTPAGFQQPAPFGGQNPPQFGTGPQLPIQQAPFGGQNPPQFGTGPQLPIQQPFGGPNNPQFGTGPQLPVEPAPVPAGSQPGVPRVTPPSRNPGAASVPPTRATPSPTSPPIGAKPVVPLPGPRNPVGRATPPAGDKPIKTPAKHPTLAHLIPPPPNATNQPPPSVLPARDSKVRLPTDSEEGAQTGAHEPVDPITAVEVDADAKAKAVAPERTDKNPVVPDGDSGLLRQTPAPAVGDPTDQIDLNATIQRARQSASTLDATTERPRPSASELATIAHARQAAPDGEAVTVRAPPSVRDLDKSRAQIEDAKPTLEQPRPSASDLNATLERPRASLSEMDATLERPRESAPALDAPPAAKPPAAGEGNETKVPISTAPASLPPPKKTTVAMTGPTPACPQCEAPMAWVEEHLRFYCASCRMYF